ncbi:zinc uptake protein ZrgA [Enterovibrio baiacu]|uniref:zinc uptake protein ZrgA n=1 Tax=Enterovibrio baiacu TaxID=2491023 RepID=UPI003D0EF582
MRTTPLFTLSAVALCLSSTAFAESAEFRQHSAHQHGLVEWVIAQDGNDLLVEIAAPGSDVVGFEHAPKNDEQTTALNSALIALADANALFAVNSGANCSLEEKNISHTLAASKEDDHDDHGHDDHKGHDDHGHDDHKGHDDHGHDDHKGHDDHGHDDHKGHDDHGHDDHKGHDDHDHDEHKGHDHHDHHDHEGEDGHGEFNVQYTFHCDNPENLKSVSTSWFKAFPQTEQIKVQSLTDIGVTAADMTASSNTFKF